MLLPVSRAPVRFRFLWFQKKSETFTASPHTDTCCRERTDKSLSGVMIMRSKDPSTLRIVDLWTFKSARSNKRYIVEVEKFTNHFLGLKFYWKGVANSKLRYSLLTNDYEPRTIVMSCVHIMLEYFKRDKCASFGFVAASDLRVPVTHNVPNKRFRFYRRMMLSIFGSETFVQGV